MRHFVVCATTGTTILSLLVSWFCTVPDQNCSFFPDRFLMYVRTNENTHFFLGKTRLHERKKTLCPRPQFNSNQTPSLCVVAPPFVGRIKLLFPSFFPSISLNSMIRKLLNFSFQLWCLIFETRSLHIHSRLFASIVDLNENRQIESSFAFSVIVWFQIR